MTDTRDRVCPVENAGGLDNGIRRWLQNPRRLLGPYVREGMTALDFGCGPGFFTLELARLVGSSGRVIAADLQAGMLDKVRVKIRGTAVEARIVLHQCQPSRIGLTLPVDFALAFYMVHELPDPAAFFTEVRQLLSAQGQVLIVEPPFHVTKAAFESTLRTAQRAGFTVAARPRVTFSKAALLQPTC
jgi:ubiquinone/menaquinone biosynthesis C-methylase UbiE